MGRGFGPRDTTTRRSRSTMPPCDCWIYHLHGFVLLIGGRKFFSPKDRRMAAPKMDSEVAVRVLKPCEETRRSPQTTQGISLREFSTKPEITLQAVCRHCCELRTSAQSSSLPVDRISPLCASGARTFGQPTSSISPAPSTRKTIVISTSSASSAAALTEPGYCRLRFR